jgi:pimeloyl-ACP methyl ester carboxylesterase
MSEQLGIVETGSAGSPTVVFLHGVGTTRRMWARHTAALADYHCVVPDLPGHGESAEMPWRSLRGTAEAVAELIHTRGTGGRAHVVGLSLGGALTYVLLAHHDELLESVVVDGAAVLPDRLAPAMIAGVWAISPFLHRDPVIGALARMVGVPPADRESFAADLRSVRPRAFRAAFAAAQDPGVMDDVLGTLTPTLLLSGEKELASMHAANAALAALMPHAEARVAPDVGHGWCAARPQLHVAALRAWFEHDALPGELTAETASWWSTRAGRRISLAAEGRV